MSVYVNGLLMAVLRPALAAVSLDPAFHLGTRLPAGYVQHLPFARVRATPGGFSRGAAQDSPLTRFGVPVQADIYAADEGRAAHDLGDVVVAALRSAQALQLVTDDGHLASFTNISGPIEFPEPDRADGVVRHLITATLTARPSAPA
jgi:hypothetical protein